MSGEKYKTISQAEYDRLRREAMQATTERERRLALERLNQRLADSARIAQNANAALNGRVTALNGKLAAAEKTASELKKELYETVRSTNKALSDQRIKFESDLAKTRSDFADVLDRNNRRVEEVIQKNAEALHGKIDELRAQTAADVKNLNAKISALAEKVGDPQKVVAMAGDYLDVANELLKEAKGYRHGLLLPGRLKEVTAALELAKQTKLLSEKNPAAAAAALVRCQEAFEVAKKFYDDLLAAENEWAAKRALALEALASAEARIKANEKVKVWGREFDVNYWTNGSLKKLQELTDKLRQQLENPEKANTLTCENLEDLAAGAQLITDDADDVLTGARIALECSDERIALAAELADELAKQAGMEQVKGHGYEGDDQRAANMIHLKSGTTGFEVVITLIPEVTGGSYGWRAETKIVNPGKAAAVAANFDAILRQVMAAHGLGGNCPIPVDPNAAEALKGWAKREEVTVPVIATPGADTIAIPQ